jgi:hypothetical protein
LVGFEHKTVFEINGPGDPESGRRTARGSPGAWVESTTAPGTTADRYNVRPDWVSRRAGYVQTLADDDLEVLADRAGWTVAQTVAVFEPPSRGTERFQCRAGQPCRRRPAHGVRGHGRRGEAVGRGLVARPGNPGLTNADTCGCRQVDGKVQPAVVWSLPLQGDSGGPTSISRTAPLSTKPYTTSDSFQRFVTHDQRKR